MKVENERRLLSPVCWPPPTLTSPSHRSQAPCSGQISSEGGFLLLALDLKLFLLSVWFLPYQLDEIKTYPTLQEVLVLVRLMVMGSTNHLLFSFFFSLCFCIFVQPTLLQPSGHANYLRGLRQFVIDQESPFVYSCLLLSKLLFIIVIF